VSTPYGISGAVLVPVVGGVVGALVVNEGYRQVSGREIAAFAWAKGAVRRLLPKG
jgi:hypothetical protein